MLKSEDPGSEEVTTSGGVDRPFTRMLIMQEELQRMYGHDITNMTVAQRVAYLKEFSHALLRELGEAEDETSWKNWTRGEPFFHAERIREELVDAWHFFMNCWLAACLIDGETSPAAAADQLYAMYLAKHDVNIQRQLDGYDGVTGKCPACRRDLQESPPTRVEQANGTTVLVHHAPGCGTVLEGELYL